jgi:predicted transcriptional regulator
MALRPEQLVAIGYLSQPNKGGKTMNEIAAECGVSRQAVYKWTQDDEFDAELRRQTKRNVSKLVPDVVNAMYDASVADKNAAAAKLILTMAEMLTDKVEVDTKGSDKTPSIDELKRLIADIDN